MATNYVKFYRGTTAKYQSAVKAGTVNSDTLYFIQDNGQTNGALYLGTTLISKDISNFYELNDINLADVLHNNDLLVYSEKQEKWVNKSILDAIGIFIGAKDGKQGTNGLVPAPGEKDANLFLRGDGVWAAPEAQATITIDVDNKSLSFLDDEKTISLHNFGKKYYAYVNNSYVEQIVDEFHPWKEGLEPRVVNEEGQLVLGWYEPNTNTIEGITSQISSLHDELLDIKEVIGAPASVGQVATGLYAKADADSVYTKQETQDLIASKLEKVGHLSRKTFTSIEVAQEFINSISDPENYIYMISAGEKENNKYEEYLYIENSLEKIGAWDVELTDYATKEEVANKVDKVEGKTLIDITEIQKLATVKENAEPNFIKSVDETELKVDNGLLSVISVVPSKIVGLNDLLNEKADKTELNAVKEEVTDIKSTLNIVNSSIIDITAQLNNFVTLETFNSEIDEIKNAITWKSI